MSPNNQHLPSNQELLGLWLDGKLDAKQQEQFEQRCVEDADFAAQVASASMMQAHVEDYESRDVPQWDRLASFDAPVSSKWWQWQGLPACSFATAMLAIVLLISDFSVQLNNGVLTAGFGADPALELMEKKFEQRIRDFEQDQALALSRYAQNLQQQQLANSTDLTKYLLESSRIERREDFAELINFINQQRNDDQLFYARQLNEFQQDVYSQPNVLNNSIDQE